VADFEKLLASVSNAPANTDFATLVQLMELAGFQLRMGKKQHAIFTNKTHAIRRTVAKPHHGPVKPVYVRECLKAIEELRFAQEKPNA
jgi:predicted RNA binding protein YcfA (HicA-like mRNA interferase family)